MGTINKEANRISAVYKAVDDNLVPYRRQVSPSQYSDFSRCKYKWQLHNRDRNFNAADNTDTAFGHIIHSVLEDWVKVRYKDGKEAASNFDWESNLKSAIRQEAESIKEKWDRKDQGRPLPIEKSDLIQFYEDGLSAFHEFQSVSEEIFGDRYELLMIEESVGYPIGRKIKFHGLVDIVLYDKETEKIKVIDIKTSRRGWSDYKKEDRTVINQLLCYKYFVYKTIIDEDADLEDVDVEFLIFNRAGTGDYKGLKYIEIFSPPDSEEDVKRSLNEFIQFRNEVVSKVGLFYDKQYEKNPTKYNCKVCQYSSQFGNGKCNQNGEIF